VITPKEGACIDLEALKDRLKKTLLPFQIPKKLILVDSRPMAGDKEGLF